jgi:hypothetical protein
MQSLKPNAGCAKITLLQVFCRNYSDAIAYGILSFFTLTFVNECLTYCTLIKKKISFPHI